MPRSFRIHLQEKKIEALKDTYDSWKAEHHGAMMAFDMEDAIVSCREFTRDFLEKDWRYTWNNIQKGDWSRDPNLESIGSELVHLLERLERVLERAQADARAVAHKTGQTIQGVDELIADLERVRDLHQKLAIGWPWQDRPWPPLNRAMQEQSRSEQDGLGEDVESILQRLQSGGPLVME